MLSACGQIQSEPGKQNTGQNLQESAETEEIKVSPDKYTWYIKNYVGRNAASFGYTSLGGDRTDTYGAGYLKIVFVNARGTYIDIENDDELKQYVVTDQNIEPNTEMKYIFEKDEDGQESEDWVEHQTYEEIVLGVKTVGKADEVKKDVMEINASPDVYTQYVRDYTGRNAADCGYISLSEDLMDTYGDATVELILIPEDGSYVDLSDEEMIKKYKVTGQSVAPNTEMKLEYMKDEEGKEDLSWVENQNITEIELYVTEVNEE